MQALSRVSFRSVNPWLDLDALQQTVSAPKLRFHKLSCNIILSFFFVLFMQHDKQLVTLWCYSVPKGGPLCLSASSLSITPSPHLLSSSLSFSCLLSVCLSVCLSVLPHLSLSPYNLILSLSLARSLVILCLSVCASSSVSIAL